MFNEELKRRFIREQTTSSHTANGYEFAFNAIEDLETDAGMDVCQMNVSLLQNVFDRKKYEAMAY